MSNSTRTSPRKWWKISEEKEIMTTVINMTETIEAWSIFPRSKIIMEAEEKKTEVDYEPYLISPSRLSSFSEDEEEAEDLEEPPRQQIEEEPEKKEWIPTVTGRFSKKVRCVTVSQIFLEGSEQEDDEPDWDWVGRQARRAIERQEQKQQQDWKRFVETYVPESESRSRSEVERSDSDVSL